MRYVLSVLRSPSRRDEGWMLYVLFHFLTDIDIELWGKVKAKATLERKTMRDVIVESPNNI